MSGGDLARIRQCRSLLDAAFSLARPGLPSSYPHPEPLGSFEPEPFPNSLLKKPAGAAEVEAVRREVRR